MNKQLSALTIAALLTGCNRESTTEPHTTRQASEKSNVHPDEKTPNISTKQLSGLTAEDALSHINFLISKPDLATSRSGATMSYLIVAPNDSRLSKNTLNMRDAEEPWQKVITEIANQANLFSYTNDHFYAISNLNNYHNHIASLKKSLPTTNHHLSNSIVTGFTAEVDIDDIVSYANERLESNPENIRIVLEGSSTEKFYVSCKDLSVLDLIAACGSAATLNITEEQDTATRSKNIKMTVITKQ